jgi:hypothetical protein
MIGGGSSSAWKRTSFDPLDHLPDPTLSSAGTLQTPKGTLISQRPSNGSTATTTSILSRVTSKEGPGSRNPNSPAVDTVAPLPNHNNTNNNGGGGMGAGAPVINGKRQSGKLLDDGKKGLGR